MKDVLRAWVGLTATLKDREPQKKRPRWKVAGAAFSGMDGRYEDSLHHRGFYVNCVRKSRCPSQLFWGGSRRGTSATPSFSI